MYRLRSEFGGGGGPKRYPSGLPLLRSYGRFHAKAASDGQ